MPPPSPLRRWLLILTAALILVPIAAAMAQANGGIGNDFLPRLAIGWGSLMIVAAPLAWLAGRRLRVRHGRGNPGRLPAARSRRLG
jgi:hypothetical protein